MKIIIAIIVFCIVTIDLSAQNVKPANVGDTVPDSLWNMPLQVVNHPQQHKTIKLSEFRNKKLIIIDFWATWCSPCVASLNKTIPIYRKYSDDMVLLPVTSHDSDAAQKVENRMQKLGWDIPSVLDAKMYLYNTSFPPGYGTGIPRMIWISGGKIIAIPKVAYATEENILKAIKGEPLNIPNKPTNLKPLNYTLPLFVKDNGQTGLYFRKRPYSVIARNLPGYGTGSKTIFLRKNDTTIIAGVNRTLENLCFDAWQQWIFPGLKPENGIIWQVSDSLKSRLFNGPKYDKTFPLDKNIAWNEWIKKNTYGYNLRYPQPISEKEAYYFMQQDISKFFGIYLRLKFNIAAISKQRYAVLRVSNSVKLTETALQHKSSGNSRQYQNVHFTQGLLSKVSKAIPDLSIKGVLDSTGLNPNLKVDFDFPDELNNNPQLLTEALKRYGLVLSIQERDVPVLIVTQQQPNKTKEIIKQH